MTSPNTPRPSFEVDSSLTEWTIPAQDWLSQHEEENNQASHRLDGLCSGNAVFNSEKKILLIQRASHDSSPNKWELPGGAVDAEDPSILYGAARELFEEAGLVATRFRAYVSSEGKTGWDSLDVFPNRHATRWFGRAIFVVDVHDCANVQLDPNEHQDFVWAGESEVMDGKVGDRSIEFTYPTMRRAVLAAFAFAR